MNEEIELPAQNYGPGNVLRAKREEYEWSIEAVAEALHLSTSSVKAIEADRYEDLPGATYVIGYWRSYARLLGIDIEDTVEANKRNLNIVVPETTGFNVNRAHHHKNGSGILWVSLLLIALAAFGYYIWQQQFFGLLDQFQLFKAEQSVSSSAPDTSGNSTLPEPVIKETEVLRPLDRPEEQMVDTQMPNALNGAIESPPTTMGGGSAEQVTDSILRPLANDPASTVAPPSEVSPSLGNLQQGLVLPSGNDKQSTAAPTNENANNFLQNQSSGIASNEVAVIQPANNTGTLAGQSSETSVLQNVTDNAASIDESTLFLSLSKDSWLDIRDKTNKRLLYRTETAGKQISVKGTPPFYVYIGTPSGVNIKYKGQDVPFETHKSGLFARFKLGDTLESL